MPAGVEQSSRLKRRCTAALQNVAVVAGHICAGVLECGSALPLLF
jgi:hypothetical protein